MFVRAPMRSGRQAATLPSFVVGILAAALAGAPTAVSAQGTGTVIGSVTDGAGRPLAGAIVRVNATTLVAAAGRDGGYRITDVAAGSRTVIIRYIGFKPETVTVTVTAGRIARADASLKPSVSQLAAIKVEGQVRGQAAALNQQRSADVVGNIIDNELIGRLPDQNMAEALQRVPGIAIDRDQGEGRFVQIRGTSPQFNSLSVNGERVPTANSSNRAVQMDIVPSDQAAVIQVTKTLTADMDADAIGGNVNIVTRAATSKVPTLNLTTAVGQNVLGSGAVQNFTGNVGRRFGAKEQFGIMVGGTYYRNDRASQNFEGTWCVQTNNCGLAGSASQSSLNAPNLWELRDYPQVDRLRKGANATADWRISDNHKITVRSSWSEFSDDEIRFRTRFGFLAGTASRWNMVSADSGVTTGSRMDRDIRLRKIISDIQMLQLSGDHSIGDQQITWSLAGTTAKENRPLAQTLAFRQSNMSLAYNFADADRPRAYVVTGSYDDPARFPFSSYTLEQRKTKDADVSARLNWSKRYALGSTSGLLKAGFVARLKDRDVVNNTFTSTSALGTNALGATGATLFSSLASATGRPTFDGAYNLGRSADVTSVRNFLDQTRGTSAFTRNDQSSTQTSAGGTYKVQEDIYAGFLMTTLDIGSLRILPGVRYEITRNQNTANRLDVTSTTTTVTPRTVKADYGSVFPSIGATYRLAENTVVRAAATTAIIRPDFGDLVPRIRVNAGDNFATIGNENLRPTRAANLDFMAEHYFSNVGVLSAGVFYKDLTDIIYTTSRPLQASESYGTGVVNVLQPINGNKAKVYGAEIGWQQNLSFLPSLLKGIGVNTNLTLTNSETTYDGRGTKKYPLYGQTGTAANAGVFYDRGPLSLRVGVNYAGEFVSLVAPVEAADQRRMPRTQVDAAGSIRLVGNTKIFFEAINLSNTPYRSNVGNNAARGGGGEDPSYEFYKPWYTAGVRIQR